MVFFLQLLNVAVFEVAAGFIYLKETAKQTINDKFVNYHVWLLKWGFPPEMYLQVGW